MKKQQIWVSHLFRLELQFGSKWKKMFFMYAKQTLQALPRTLIYKLHNSILSLYATNVPQIHYVPFVVLDLLHNNNCQTVFGHPTIVSFVHALSCDWWLCLQRIWVIIHYKSASLRHNYNVRPHVVGPWPRPVLCRALLYIFTQNQAPYCSQLASTVTDQLPSHSTYQRGHCFMWCFSASLYCSSWPLCFHLPSCSSQ